ncbi:MAG TPA: AI-2E family transporter [Bacteriovoracaceae bacterium]|nr:AI-2E family transporter [Bacteriovoracaceae bacterium]
MSKQVEKNSVRIIYVVILVLMFLFLVSPFVIPIVFAATVSLALFPVQAGLLRRGFQKGRAAALLTTVFTFVISIPLFFFIVKGTSAVTNQLEEMALKDKMKDQGVQEIVNDMRHDLVVYLHDLAVKFKFDDFLTMKKIGSYLSMVMTFLLNFFQAFAASLPVLFLFLLIMVLCTFSFLKHSTEVRQFFQKIFGFNDTKMDELVHVYIKDSRQVYISNIATGGIQSLMVAIGVYFLGFGSFFLVFFITLILSFIPVVGAAPVAFVFALVAWAKGNTTAAIILGVLGMVTGVVDNILRPWLASLGESRIPPVVAFVCVIGGALLLGFPGLFIGLLIGSIAYDTLPLFWSELGKTEN